MTEVEELELRQAALIALFGIKNSHPTLVAPSGAQPGSHNDKPTQMEMFNE
jgi:hypothetical protein